MRNKKKYHCKDEELPVITGFVVDSLERDLNDFSAFSPKFNTAYLGELKSKLLGIELIFTGKKFTAELKKVTSNLNEVVASLRPRLNQIEGYVKLAGSALTTETSGFGVSAVRKPLNRGNVEGILAASNLLLHNIAINEHKLAEQGLSPDTTRAFLRLVTTIDSLNREQNRLAGQRAVEIEMHLEQFNDLWEMLSEVLVVGRSLYKGVDSVRLKDYTMAWLRKRVNAELSGVQKTARKAQKAALPKP
jgi:hypothetical protein